MRFAVSYSIVTPESAADGDEAEHGMLGRDLSLRDAVELVCEYRDVECIEPNEWPMRSPRWVTVTGSVCTRDGSQASRSLHFPDDMTGASRRRVCRLLGVRQ